MRYQRLIAASPSEVPWHVQYDLNPVRNVGRLDLDDEGLDRYVSALLDDWSGLASRHLRMLFLARIVSRIAIVNAARPHELHGRRVHVPHARLDPQQLVDRVGCPLSKLSQRSESDRGFP